MGIIKSMTRRTASYKQLIEYMLKGQRETATKDESFIIRHNLRSSTLDSMVKEFAANEANRRHKRSGGIKIYHEVYSVKQIGKNKVTPAVLKDLGQKFIELRAPNSVCIAVPHYTDNPHIHFMMGGVAVESGLSLRTSKQEFAEFKKELDAYAHSKYPQLFDSRVDHGKKQREKTKSLKDCEYQLTKRTKTPSEKEIIKQAIEQSYSLSLSRANFMHRLREQGLQTYSRNGTERGVISGERKFTFSHLGFDQKHLKEIDLRDEALKGIQVFRDDKEKEIENDMTMDREIEYKSDTDHKEGKDEEENNDDEMEQDLDMATDLDIDI